MILTQMQRAFALAITRPRSKVGLVNMVSRSASKINFMRAGYYYPRAK